MVMVLGAGGGVEFLATYIFRCRIVTKFKSMSFFNFRGDLVEKIS